MKPSLLLSLSAALLASLSACSTCTEAPLAMAGEARRLVNTDERGVALEGHDPVAFFTVGKPVKGSTAFHFDWDGERYLFSSAANRDLFAANPEKYAPQFGGYCTGSMSRKVQAEANPEAWIISDGKLYVFGQTKWVDVAQKDPEYLRTRIPLAAANWRERGK